MIDEKPTFNALKKLSKTSGEGLNPKVKIALLGNFSTQLLNIALKGAGVHLGVELEIYEADFDQIDIQIIDPKSDFYAFEPDWVIIFHDNQAVKTKFFLAQDKTRFADNFIEQLERYYVTIRERINSKVIINNLYTERDSVFGAYSSKVPESFAYQVQKINFQLTSFFEHNGNAFMFDLAGLVGGIGLQNFLDNRLWVNSVLPYQLESIAIIAFDLAKIIYNGIGKFKKCLILDLDNTMWGGIIGDDGLEGIKIGNNGTGKVFKDLQMWFKSLKERGVILAICTKNEESAAKEPFDKHPEMVLRMDDISIFVSNWKPKFENIKYIQQVLKISFDSMVFLDDNPMERDIIRKYLKDVVVPELPNDPSEYLRFIYNLDLFFYCKLF
jgi:HAD superfamily phosphatase (TIGR01681 family)